MFEDWTDEQKAAYLQNCAEGEQKIKDHIAKEKLESEAQRKAEKDNAAAK